MLFVLYVRAWIQKFEFYVLNNLNFDKLKEIESARFKLPINNQIVPPKKKHTDPFIKINLPSSRFDQNENNWSIFSCYDYILRMKLIFTNFKVWYDESVKKKKSINLI